MVTPEYYFKHVFKSHDHRVFLFKNFLQDSTLRENKYICMSLVMSLRFAKAVYLADAHDMCVKLI